jgi:two-component system nitrate/nitrite response regulator NarL
MLPVIAPIDTDRRLAERCGIASQVWGRMMETNLPSSGAAAVTGASLVLCDDHVLFAQGLQGMLHPPHTVIAFARSTEQLLGVLSSVRPDCILLDLSMPGTNGIEALPQIRSVSPRSRVVIVTMFCDHRDLARECLRIGAHGFVPKSAGRDELLHAISAVLQGRHYISPLVPKNNDRCPALAPGLEHLTPRQLQILRLVGQPLSPVEIGRRLGLSAPTISTHIRLIRRRLGASSQEALLKLAVLLRLNDSVEVTLDSDSPAGRQAGPHQTATGTARFVGRRWDRFRPARIGDWP